MNNSGECVGALATFYKIAPEQIIVISDDMELDCGRIRIRRKGSAGGHNGLKSIESCIQAQNYARLKFGIGSNFARGQQIDYVLGAWDDDEEKHMPELLKTTTDIIASFCLQGLPRTMTQYNNFKLQTNDTPR